MPLTPESQIPSPAQGGQGPDVVEWLCSVSTQTQRTVSPALIVDVLVPLTGSTKLFPPWPTLTIHVTVPAQLRVVPGARVP